MNIKPLALCLLVVIGVLGIWSSEAVALHPSNSGVRDSKELCAEKETVVTGKTHCTIIAKKDCETQQQGALSQIQGQTGCGKTQWHLSKVVERTDLRNTDTSSDPSKKCDPTTAICSPIKSTSFNQLLDNIIKWLTILATPILTFMIVYAGFLYTTSGGSTTQTDKAKSVIKHAVIGFVIIGLAYVIKSIVGSIV